MVENYPHDFTKTHKKLLSVTIKVMISFSLIWFLMRGIDISSVVDHLISVKLGMLVGAMVVIQLQVLICILRWRAVLEAITKPLSFGKLLKYFYVGTFYNQVLPSSVGGDVVRVYKSYRAGLTLGKAINGVFLDRVATVLALIVLATAGMPLFIERVNENITGWIVPLTIILFVSGVVGLALLMVPDRMPVGLHRWRVMRGFSHLSNDTRLVFLNPLEMFRVLGWSVFGHANLGLCVYLLGLGLGLEVTLIDCLIIVPFVLLMMTVPISIAGWGVREAGMIAGFSLVGVPADGALALSVLFGLVTAVMSLPGGMLLLLNDRQEVAG